MLGLLLVNVPVWLACLSLPIQCLGHHLLLYLFQFLSNFGITYAGLVSRCTRVWAAALHSCWVVVVVFGSLGRPAKENVISRLLFWGSEYQTCQVQWGSEYRTTLVFKWSKAVVRLEQSNNLMTLWGRNFVKKTLRDVSGMKFISPYFTWYKSLLV